jgi:hypothetical protein
MTCINHKTQSLQKACQETTACHKATEVYTEKIQLDPRMMQSIAEHQEVPKEEATLMPVGGLRKQCRDRNLTMGRRQKPKGRIQASCESQKRLIIAGRKMTRHARVAWHREDVIRKDQTRKQVERGASKGRGPRMQNGNKEPGRKTAATTQEGIQQNPQEDPRAGDRETSS